MISFTSAWVASTSPFFWVNLVSWAEYAETADFEVSIAVLMSGSVTAL